MKRSARLGSMIGFLAAAGLAILASHARGSDFADYGSGQRLDMQLPTVAGGWYVTADFFPDTATAMVGNYQAKGRLIVANNQTLYLQKTYGSSEFVPVARTSGVMEPSFIRVSPDGSKIALGPGAGQPLMVFPTSVLQPNANPAAAPLLDTDSRVSAYPVSYYDADWLDNQHLIFNGGTWPAPPEGSGVGALDTDDPGETIGVELISGIPGYSAGVAVDHNGNVLTGIGLQFTGPRRTGEIKLFTHAQILAALSGSPIDYGDEATGNIVATQVLSAASLGVDAENNLYVGGGDVFGTGGAAELGFAAIISSSVLDRVANGTGGPADEAEASDYKELAPDPCGDDSATTVVYSKWARGLGVIWNPDEGGGCKDPGKDEWQIGVTPVLSIFYPGSAPDTDADGVPDGSDNAYLTSNPGQEDSDDDGYGDVADADLNNDGEVNFQDIGPFSGAYGSVSGQPQYDPSADFNGDGKVDFQDLGPFSGRYGSQEPWY